MRKIIATLDTLIIISFCLFFCGCLPTQSYAIARPSRHLLKVMGAETAEVRKFYKEKANELKEDSIENSNTADELPDSAGTVVLSEVEVYLIISGKITECVYCRIEDEDIAAATALLEKYRDEYIQYRFAVRYVVHRTIGNDGSFYLAEGFPEEVSKPLIKQVLAIGAVADYYNVTVSRREVHAYAEQCGIPIDNREGKAWAEFLCLRDKLIRYFQSN